MYVLSNKKVNYFIMEGKDTFKFKLDYYYEEIARSLNMDSSILLDCLRERDIISQEEEEWIWEGDVISIVMEEKRIREEEEWIRKAEIRRADSYILRWCYTLQNKWDPLTRKKEQLQRDRQSLV